MRLVISTYVPEGIVVALESHQSITIEGKTLKCKVFKIATINSDSFIKTCLIEE